MTRHPLKSAPLTIAAMPWPPRRVIPGRDTCTGACETRGGCDCVRGFPHTVPTDYGSADALEPAEACTDVGAEPGDLEPGPALLASLVGPVLIVLVSAICALLLAAGWPMAWPLG